MQFDYCSLRKDFSVNLQEVSASNQTIGCRVARTSMVLSFGSRLSHYPTNAKSSLVLRFPLIASLHTAAFSCGWCACAQLRFLQVNVLSMPRKSKRLDWSLKSNADGRGLDPPIDNGDGRTRLLKTVKNLRRRLNSRIEELRKDLPRKFFFFLVGFYCATVFATFIGQTGEWDILSAAVAVAVVEGIGALMYKASLSTINKTRMLIVMFNYWKAGLTLGLFLDSFKF